MGEVIGIYRYIDIDCRFMCIAGTCFSCFIVLACELTPIWAIRQLCSVTFRTEMKVRNVSFSSLWSSLTSHGEAIHLWPVHPEVVQHVSWAACFSEKEKRELCDDVEGKKKRGLDLGVYCKCSVLRIPEETSQELTGGRVKCVCVVCVWTAKAQRSSYFLR